MSELKSYRPISLPSVLGKILVRLLDNRLWAHFIVVSPLLVHQFGFMSAGSAKGAIHTGFDTVHSSAAKYVVVVFFDISGSFDYC